jgi:hypothetical protein
LSQRGIIFKSRLLRVVWAGPRGKLSAYDLISLNIPEEIEHLMEDRRIRREDVQRVIHNAETTGEKFVNPSTGRSLASLRPDRVTFWVEYSLVGGDYQVHSAYSHRMEMKRGGTP